MESKSSINQSSGMQKIGIKILISVIAFFAILALIITLMTLFFNPDFNLWKEGPEETEEETDPPPMEVADGDDFNYAILDDGKKVAVLGLSLPYGAVKVEIPDNYNGVPITAICDGAFASDVHLTSVTIPDSVTHIGSQAFDGCVNLTDVTVSKNLEYVGGGAFGSCDKLKLTEHENAMYLGNEEAPYTLLMSAKDRKIEDCIIHNDTRVIYELAFADCTEVDTITIPNGIMQIGIEAFKDCYDLEYTAVEGNIRYLGNESSPYLVCFEAIAKRTATEYTVHSDTRIIYPAAFHEAKLCESVTISNSVISIGAYAFDACTALSEIRFESITEWSAIDEDDITNETVIKTNSENIVESFTKTNVNCTFVKQ